MTDEQTWAIVNAPGDVPAQRLADQLGLTYSAVHSRRWQLRRRGWSCKVHWDPCPECGKPLIERRRTQVYHGDCRSEVLRRLNASYETGREYSDLQLKAREDRRNAHYERTQALTRPRAISHMRRYTSEDDELLIELSKTMTHEEIALEVGRTRAAVQTRLKMIRERSVSYR